MAQKQIVIEIETDGSTSIDAQGFAGSSCTVATRELEVLLAGGSSGVSDKKKPDFYARVPGTNVQAGKQ